MYKILGIANIVLLALVTAPYWVRKMTGILFTKVKLGRTTLMKVLRTLHKPAGVGVLLITLIHGYLALGSFRLHTGTLAGLSVVITVILGVVYSVKRTRALFKAHKLVALITVLLTLLHLIKPDLFYVLLR